MILAKMWNPQSCVILDFVKNAGGVVKTKRSCSCSAPGGRLKVMLSDELAEVEQYSPVLLTQTQLILQEAVASALHNFGPLRRADRQVEVMGEGKEESFSCQAAERAL